MTTALSEFFHNPLKSRDDYSSGKINNSSTSRMNNGGVPRRTSSSNGSYSSRPLSTLEDSGNLNNRDVYQQGSMQRSDSNRSNNNANASADQYAYEETIIEENRKRANGEGFTVHRYTLGRLLGKGGFAKVYLCTAMDTGKNYAVKVVPKANLVKARARQKLQAEIKIHRNLKHRYVCQYKHYFEDKNNCYILLELCHNQSLNEMIKRRKRLTEPEAAYFMKQLLEATRYMHDQNVIHRDLKLGNLFLDKDMVIKVGDLGLATRVEDKDEKRKTICGTPNYIAPEIIQGDKSKRGHSFEVDVWSMGVILYTVLIGKPPYEAKDVKSTYQRILNNEYSFPRNVEVSPYAKSLIQSMLQSVPSDRPTLDEIEAHPFLADSQIPTSLPTSALSVVPTWRINGYGELVCGESTDAGCSASTSKMPALPRSSSRTRQPFASRDPNHAATNRQRALSKQRSSKDVVRTEGVNVERVVKSAVSAVASCAGHGTFQIYEESPKEPDSKQKNAEVKVESLHDNPRSTSKPSSVRWQKPPIPASAEDSLVQQTRALSIDTKQSYRLFGSGSASVAPSLVAASVAETVGSHTTETDAEVLQKMADHLNTVIAVTESRIGSYRAMPVRPLSPRKGPSQWVTRYVDYTSKYGLGFLLNDGCSGVYFNDSTKTALEADGDTFQYIERRKTEDGSCKLRGETVVETHTLESYPETLKKKVTLLKHFRNYLLQQQEADELTTQQQVRQDPTAGLVYVKKWVRTKHAILFSLSNRTVQVIFYDQTEILLTPDVAFLTYVDKHRGRSTYSFTDELVGCSPEIARRLKFTKEILQSLLSRS